MVNRVKCLVQVTKNIPESAGFRYLRAMTRRGALLALGTVILASAAALGILQYRWLRRGAQAEEATLRTGMVNGVLQVLWASTEEARVFESLVDLEVERVRPGQEGPIHRAYDFWQTNTRFEDLVEDAFLIGTSGETVEVRRFDARTGVFVSQDIDTIGLGRSSFPLSAVPRASYRIRRDLSSQGLTVKPLRGSGGEQTWLAVKISLSTLHARVVPAYMDRFLPGYPFRVVSAGTPIASSQPPPGVARPEVSVTLKGVHLYREALRESRADHGDERAGDAVSLWLRSSQPGAGLDSPTPDEEREGVVLEVFYPGGALAAFVRSQATVSFLLTLCILGLLVASAVFLLALYARLQRARERERDFVASMSHELRTPLAVLQAASSNLQDRVVTDPDRLVRYGTVIGRESRRLTRLVEGVLLYSGLEARKALPREDVDVASLVSETVESLRDPALEVGAEIRCSIDVPSTSIRSDEVGLRLVLENLLMNAIRHGSAAGPAPELRVSLRAAGGDLRLVVEDDGEGIPAREARRIFEPFARGEASVRARRRGSGLGLHLARRVMESLGGTLILESPYRDERGGPHGGCRFTATLPAGGG